jgi:hypothetical protein
MRVQCYMRIIRCEYVIVNTFIYKDTELLTRTASLYF